MMDETPQGTEHPQQPAERSQWAPAPARQPADKTRTDWERVARTWIIVLSLVVLSVSLLTALIAANQAVTIWLQPQYAPFVRVAGALVVAAVALYTVWRLTRQQRA